MKLKTVRHLILPALLAFGIGNVQAQPDRVASTQHTMLAAHVLHDNDSTTTRPLRKGTRPFGAQPDGNMTGSNVS